MQTKPDSVLGQAGGPNRTSQPPEGRYEYRIWPGSGHPAIAILNGAWTLSSAERRSDIYLLHPASDRALVKLRSGDRLEIKRRGRDVASIQHWSMPLSTNFPLAASDRNRLADTLGLRRILPEEAGLSAAHLLSEVATRDDCVIPRTVTKSRLLFRTSGCRAEICRVGVGRWGGKTIALEGNDLTSLALAVEHLNLGSLPNRSYGEALLRLVIPNALGSGLLVRMPRA
ncbi:MAG: hypothetical protein ACEPO2_08625 [Pelagibaca sp.]